MTTQHQIRLSQFPRTNDLPTQSPKYWVKEKDRYLRQLMITDIEGVTGRPLVVYYSQSDQEIGHSDPDDLSEVLQGVPSKDIDLFIQTPGGDVDATEKLISILQSRLTSYRVIVPSWAKSAGTVLALSSQEIVLGVNSELGPIDPQFTAQNGARIPCEILANDPQQPYHIQQLASLAVRRMRALAKHLLQTGMMSNLREADIDRALDKISSTQGYLSHGAVIDYSEASDLGLKVTYLEPTDDLWRRLWLLYCMYDFDANNNDFKKIFEGSRFSLLRPK